MNIEMISARNMTGFTGDISSWSVWANIEWISVYGCVNLTGNLTSFSALTTLTHLALYNCGQFTGNMAEWSTLVNLTYIGTSNGGDFSFEATTPWALNGAEIYMNSSGLNAQDVTNAVLAFGGNEITYIQNCTPVNLHGDNAAPYDTQEVNDAITAIESRNSNVSIHTPSGSPEAGTEYNDWYLPNQSEMGTVYHNVHNVHGLGGFSNTEYWVSLNANPTDGSVRNMETGASSSAAKGNTLNARPMRDFIAATGLYSNRDSGPAGGIICYVDDTYGEVDETKYYEIAPASMEFTHVWSNITDTYVSDMNTDIGGGKGNTELIIAQSGHTTSAAQECVNATITV